jgi:hypothetical protein
MRQPWLLLAVTALLPLGVLGACAEGVSSLGTTSSGAGGEGGSGTSGQGGGGAAATSSSTGSGPCTFAEDCAGFSDACNVGTCINGVCQKMPMNEGAACDDGKQCTSNDSCQAGLCTGPLNPCPATDACHVGMCDVATDSCVEVPGNDGAGCVDDDPCTLTAFCDTGACVGADLVDCTYLDGNCSVGSCDPAIGCVAAAANDGTSCDDGLFCTVSDACSGGFCSGTPNLCNGGQSCLLGSCNEQNDSCGSVPAANGSACDDGNACTNGEKCNNAVCGSGVPANPSGACNDGDACTTGEFCSAGVCGGGASVGACVTGDGCCPAGCDPSLDLDCGCFDDWLVGTPCNGIDYGNGCVPADTGYHFVGIYDGYACFWHHKNQAWNTTTTSNFYHLGLNFNVTPGVGKCFWCADKFSQPTPLAYDSCTQYFDQNNVGAWGWCAEGDPNSVGFVCIPTENNVACP